MILCFQVYHMLKNIETTKNLHKIWMWKQSKPNKQEEEGDERGESSEDIFDDNESLQTETLQETPMMEVF